jgi:hypothetical protein
MVYDEDKISVRENGIVMLQSVNHKQHCRLSSAALCGTVVLLYCLFLVTVFRRFFFFCKFS